MSDLLGNRPGRTAMIAALLALLGQSAFSKVFEGMYSIVVERQQFPMIRATIDYYRHVPNKCSPQIRNTIEMYNARIEYEHEANRQWFLIDWASTDRWNQVDVIPMRCEDNSS